MDIQNRDNILEKYQQYVYKKIINSFLISF